MFKDIVVISFLDVALEPGRCSSRRWSGSSHFQSAGLNGTLGDAIRWLCTRRDGVSHRNSRSRSCACASLTLPQPNATPTTTLPRQSSD